LTKIKRAANKIATTFGVEDVRYLRKWLVIAILIGIIAGVGSILFFQPLSGRPVFLLGQAAGYLPPSPGEEWQTIFTPITRKWIFPIVCALGELISGYIVFKWAPEAEGHGTGAAINSFHNKDGLIRRRIPLRSPLVQ
jgi:CIC family chloride channel protein